MEVAAFWVSLAAVLVAGGWFKMRGAAMKHEAIMKLIERGVALDEPQIRLLLTSDKPSPWVQPQQPPGSGRKALKVLGTLVLFAAAGLAVSFLLFVGANVPGANDWLMGVGVAAGFATFGAGLFVASRFADPPEQNGKVDDHPQ